MATMLALLLTVLLAAPPADAAAAIIPPPGPPALALVDAESHDVPWRRRPDQAVFVNIWATWCAACRDEMPLLAGLTRRYAALGLHVVAVSVDADWTAFATFASANSQPFSWAWDREKGAGAAFKANGLLPQSYLYDAKGERLWASEGVFNPEDPALKAALDKALKGAGR